MLFVNLRGFEKLNEHLSQHQHTDVNFLKLLEFGEVPPHAWSSCWQTGSRGWMEWSLISRFTTSVGLRRWTELERKPPPSSTLTRWVWFTWRNKRLAFDFEQLGGGSVLAFCRVQREVPTASVMKRIRFSPHTASRRLSRITAGFSASCRAAWGPPGRRRPEPRRTGGWGWL